MLCDKIIAGLIGPLQGNLRHFIEWREERWEAVSEDAQAHADLSTLYFLVGVAA